VAFLAECSTFLENAFMIRSRTAVWFCFAGGVVGWCGGWREGVVSG
jgi:hypothetical protein